MNSISAVYGVLICILALACLSLGIHWANHDEKSGDGLVVGGGPSGLSMKQFTDRRPLRRRDELGNAKQDDTEGALDASDHDWFDLKLWSNMTSTGTCTVLKNMCQQAGTWYLPQNSDNVTFFLQRKQQNEYPQRIIFQAKQPPSLRQCQMDPIANHLVLYGWYIHMLGEFVNRVLTVLSVMFRELQAQGRHVAFQQQSQLYLHLNPAKPTLTSHEAFTEIYRHWPLQHANELLLRNTTQCTCLRRLIFCGYEYKKHDGAMRLDMAKSMYSSRLSEKDPLAFARLRQDLRKYAVDEHPVVPHLSNEWKMKGLQNMKRVGRNADLDTSLQEWRVIGLTQRYMRRHWLNMFDVVRDCNAALMADKIVCTEIALDRPGTAMTALRQVVHHNALDALIGVHGAQLAHALWMKPHAVVVELLPFVPPGVPNGQWTRTTYTPTPVGKMFANTDLHHVGIPLKAASLTDECGLISDDNVTVLNACYAPSPQWDFRNFTVDSDLVLTAIRRLVIPHHELCADWRAAAGHDIVLYNVHCRESATAVASPHHYYWDRRLQRPVD